MPIETELVYLLANRWGKVKALVPAVEGKEGAGGIHDVEPWVGFAMISGWPSYEIAVEEDEEDEDDERQRTYHVQRGPEDWPSVAKVVFYAPLSWERARAEVRQLEEHFRELMEPSMLDGMDLFERLAAIMRHKQKHEAALQLEKATREHRLSAETAKKRRLADRADPSSVFHKAERAVRVGIGFELVRHGDYTSQNRTFESSMKKALSVLADANTIVHKLDEKPTERNDGLARVRIEYSDRTKWPDFPTHHIEFFAPPGSVLESATELGREIVDPNTPKKTLATRTDTL
jgi:hypothetical protein